MTIDTQTTKLLCTEALFDEVEMIYIYEGISELHRYMAHIPNVLPPDVLTCLFRHLKPTLVTAYLCELNMEDRVQT